MGERERETGVGKSGSESRGSDTISGDTVKASSDAGVRSLSDRRIGAHAALKRERERESRRTVCVCMQQQCVRARMQRERKEDWDSVFCAGVCGAAHSAHI